MKKKGTGTSIFVLWEKAAKAAKLKIVIAFTVL
jgi:hypothetical protein